MAEVSRFWTTNGTGDGPAGGYTAQQFYDFLRRLLITDQEASQGVIFSDRNQLACTGSATPIAVNTGSAIVHGFWYENTSSLNLAVTTPTIGTTGGRVNLKADWTAQTVRAVVNRNADGNAAIPALTQTAGSVWEVPLYTFSITTGGVITLTDARGYVAIGSKLQANAVDMAAIQDTAVNYAKIQNMAGLTVLGRSTNTLGVPDAITAGSDGDVLRRSGSGIGFGTIVAAGIANDAVTTVKILANNVTDAKLRQAAALSVIGRSANSTGDVADMAAAVDGYVLRRSGTTLGFGQIATAGIADEAVTPAKIQSRVRKILIPVHDPNSAGAQIPGYPMPDGQVTYIQGTFNIPSDYESGLTLDFLVHSPAASGNIYRRAYTYVGLGIGYTPNGIFVNTPYGAVSIPGATIVRSACLQNSWGGYDAPGNLVSFEFARDGSAGSDTLNNVVIFMGILLTYTADS